MKRFYFLVIILFAKSAISQNVEPQEKYYNVDRSELYLKNSKNVGSVDYFYGKIILSNQSNQFKCVTVKDGKDFINIENLHDGNLKVISSYSKSNFAIVSDSFFNDSKIKLNLKGPEYELVYYLTSINENEIYSSIVSGSGIFLNNNTILTNYHVVKKFDKLTIDFQDKTYPGKVIKFDKDLDIALIKIEKNVDLSVGHLIFANYEVEVGSDVLACGYPLLNRLGSELKITSGIISSLKGFNDDVRYLQTTAPLDPGNSGGPLIDEFGNIIGLISAKYTSGTNVGYALKIQYLTNGSFIKTNTNNRKSITTQQIYKKAKNTICIIKCFSY